MKIRKDKKYSNMYRVVWPNGDISVNSEKPWSEGGVYGFYNKTRAKEFLHREGVENYTKGLIYNSPMARLEAH